MFGMGITEILFIAIIAVIALGPDKLPDAMVKIARLFNSVKKGLNDAKTTLDKELNISELKEEANKFKAQIEDTKASLSVDSKFDLGLDDILNDDLDSKKESLNVENSKKELEDRFAKANENKVKKNEDSSSTKSKEV